MVQVVIAGAGIGGLTAAIALLQAGHDVTVFEQAERLGEVGAGVQIAANGSRVLHALGLGDAIAACASEPVGKEIRIWNTGYSWPLFDLGAESIERYGYPYYTLHRADLHDALVNGVRRERSDAIRLSSKVLGVEQDADGVTVRFADGSTHRGDVLIGADGVHSVVRQALFGPDRPTFTGCIAWRGVIPKAQLPDGLPRPFGTNWIGPGGHIVHYPLRGGELVNFVGIRERNDWQIESWTYAGTVEECLFDFEGWHEDIQILIRNIATPYKWALMVREPMDRWTVGRVTLLGDACHSTLPFLAQGANMAIEDGLVISRCLTDWPSDIPAALQHYEAARLERANRVVRGSSDITKMFHSVELTDPEEGRAYVQRNWQVDQVEERYGWLFSYDATTAPI